MVGLSFVHGGGGHSEGNHGSTGEPIGSVKVSHGGGHVRLGGHGHHGGHHHHHGAAHGKGHHGAFKVKSLKSWFALSPLDIFSYALGAGAVGILFGHTVSPAILPFLAALGALVFNFAIVKTIISGLLRFATQPSEGLEGMVAHPAEAITRFDESGRGLVRLCLDGQNVQLLATLDSTERDNGVHVSKGDRVLVTEVDPVRNTCRVTRELAL